VGEGVGVGVGGGVGAGEGDGAGVGNGAGTGAGAGTCRTTTRSDAMVSVTLRSAPAFAAALTWIVASPRPEAGFNVTHDASAAAVHPQALCVRTSITVSPPAAGIGLDGAETEYRHGAASCATSMCWSPTTIAAFRVSGSAFSDTL
jgi:hypothetical protein